MSVTLNIRVDTEGLADSAEAVQRLRNAVADRAALHAHLGDYAKEKLRADISGIQSHTTANRLGAKPSEHLAAAARKIEAQSNAERADVLLPRNSRLRAAFGSYTARPTGGRKYLTIPAHRETYGRRYGSFPPDTFRFTPFGGAGGRFKAFVFKTGSNAGEIGYWLQTEVNIEEDTTLIHFDLLRDVLADEATDYLDEILNGKGGLA